MAFHSARFSVFDTGKTGAGILCMYDGSGTADEGGDTLANIKAKGFLSDQAIKDLEAQGKDGRSLGQGIPCLYRGNDAMEFNLLHAASDGDIQAAAGNWQIT